MTKRALLFALILLALTGLTIHYRVHPFLSSQNGTIQFSGTFFLANILPFIDVVCVTALFLSRKTVVYAYLLNGLLVIFGTILMTHFSIANLIAEAVPPAQWILNSLLPDIGIAWADFFVGKALYNTYLSTSEGH
ncbi:MAG TPA: hypothetical protein VHO84_12715 [Syntrophorhabdaceae bacterium]|nr:hypothetical protein [Syntrophorhabdaceae bacterium]